MQAIFLRLTHDDYPNKLLNRFIPLVTHLLIPILIDLDMWIENLALKSKNAWLVLFVYITLARLPVNVYIP